MTLSHVRSGRALMLWMPIALGACTGSGDTRRIDTSSAEPASQAIVQPLPAATTDTTRPAAQSGDTLWLFGPSPEQDAIRANTTENLLVRQFGAANVKDDSLDAGEGNMIAGTVLFPADSLRRIEIFWDDSAPPHTRIDMLRVRGSHSLWLVTPGVTLGTTLAELEALNGRPFTLSGFDWDYGGTVTSWNGGVLDTLWGGRGSDARGHVGIRLDEPGGLPESVTRQTSGDRELKSSLPAMQAAKPVVHEFYVAPR